MQKSFHLAINNPSDLSNPVPYGYNHVVEVKRFTRIIHIAGQSGENEQGEFTTDFAQQVECAFEHLKIALYSQQANLNDIAMLRVLIVDHDASKHQLLIKTMQALWPNNQFPACTLIPVFRLALADMLFEVEATAYVE